MKKIFLVAFFIVSTFSFLKAQKDSISTKVISNSLPYECYVGAEDSNEVVTFAEEMPQFPGGDSARIKFLKDHIIYPELACENNIEARVQVQFVVSKQGKLSEIIALTKKGWGLEQEAIRVVKLMPNWIPGKQNGKPMNIRFSIPIVFKLAQTQNEASTATRFRPFIQNPQYKGGHHEMKNFILKNFKITEKIKCDSINGVVMLIVLIDSSGIIRDVCIRKSLCKEFDEEAIRVVWMMPPWIPAHEKGKAIERISLIAISNKLIIY
ncbi:MAG: TonB family protein [Bacteroidota bacterium]